MSREEACYLENGVFANEISRESFPDPSNQQCQYVKSRRTIKFHGTAQVFYLSNADIDERTDNKSDIWYTRSDLATIRKNDREALLRALRTAAENIKQGLLVPTQGAGDAFSTPPPPPPHPVPSHASGSHTVEPFCFRGMEIILYKKERDESRKRAIQAVLNEQQRLRTLGTQPSRIDTLYLESSLFSYQNRISDEYRLLTRKEYDDAYLRGLRDAHEARAIFQQSLLHISSVSSRGLNSERPMASLIPKPESLEGCSREIVDSPRDAPIDTAILSGETTLETDSYRRPFQRHQDPTSLRIVGKQPWNCWSYEQNN